MSGGASALASIQEILDSNTELLEELDTVKQELTTMREELKEALKENKKFAPYREIILDEDPTREWKQVNIRNPVTYKQLLMRTKQIHNNASPFSVASVVNSCLEYALSTGWMGVVKTKFNNLRPDNASEEAEVVDDSTA